MHRRLASILVGLSILFVQVAGVHLHVCLGAESSVEHPRVHYADRGLVFGDHHSQDDRDDEEVDLPNGSSSAAELKLPSFLVDLGPVLFWVPSVEVEPTIVVRVAARGPPEVFDTRPPYFFSPPARGPPAYS